MSTYSEPTTKKAIALFDGMNLFNAVKTLYGYSYPNFDPLKLAQLIADREGWVLAETRFYTGVPHQRVNSDRAHFWNNKLRGLRRKGVEVFTGTVNYHKQSIRLPDGTTQQVEFGYEKGVDVQIAIDAITRTRTENYDVVVLFSQDNDLSGVADAIRTLATEQGRWIKVASAFPSRPNAVKKFKRGINRTDWLPFYQPEYDACIDPKDYRAKK